MTKLKTDEIFETSDLNITAYLCLFVQIEAVNRLNPQKTIFIFKDSKELENLLDKYWRGTAAVNPLAFSNSLRNVKNRIFQD